MSAPGPADQTPMAIDFEFSMARPSANYHFSPSSPPPSPRSSASTKVIGGRARPAQADPKQRRWPGDEELRIDTLGEADATLRQAQHSQRKRGQESAPYKSMYDYRPGPHQAIAPTELYGEPNEARGRVQTAEQPKNPPLSRSAGLYGQPGTSLQHTQTPNASLGRPPAPTAQPLCVGRGFFPRPVSLPGVQAMLDGAPPDDPGARLVPVPSPAPVRAPPPASLSAPQVLYAPQRRRRRQKTSEVSSGLSPVTSPTTSTSASASTSSTSSGTAPGTSVQSPRQRVSIACTFCRARKLRCTPGPGPCEHCSRRGHLCVFDYHSHHSQNHQSSSS